VTESGRAYSIIISLISNGVESGKGSAELADLITGWPDLCLVLAFEGTVCWAGGGGDGAISARALHDAEGALRSGGAFRRDAAEDRRDRFEGVVI